MLILLAGLVLLAAAGCGDKDEAPARDQAPRALVPAGPDTAAIDTLDTTGAAEVPPAAGTPAVADAVKPAATAARSAAAKPAATGRVSLQLGSFTSEANARTQMARIAALGYEPALEVASLGGQTYHRVVLGGLADRREAERLGERIRSELGITYLIRQN